MLKWLVNILVLTTGLKGWNSWSREIFLDHRVLDCALPSRHEPQSRGWHLNSGKCISGFLTCKVTTIGPNSSESLRELVKIRYRKLVSSEVNTFYKFLPCYFVAHLLTLLRHYAISRKVASLIPDGVIGFFNWPNLSSRTMTLGSTQPLTEMSTRNLPGGKGWPVREAGHSPPTSAEIKKMWIYTSTPPYSFMA
jgi:hypothetical protein